MRGKVRIFALDRLFPPFLGCKFSACLNATLIWHLYTTKEMLGKGLSLVHNAEQINRVKELREQYGGIYIADIGHKRKNSSYFPALVTGSTITNEDGVPMYYSATVADITELKQTAF